MWNQCFDGYCPESSLKGDKVKMRLNSNDFFESEKTGLQIAISYPGVHAVVLKFRGDGKFRNTIKYAHEVENGELLSPQLVDRFPYCGDELFGDEAQFVTYISQIVGSKCNNKTNDSADFGNTINRYREFNSDINIFNHRNSSFDYCYNYFRNVDISIDVEKSCLALGFYLASWGMLRGSGFLLQRSYKYYEKLILYVAKQQKEKEYLWNIDVNSYPENYEQLQTIYEEIKEIVIEPAKAHLTIITKIMLGVYGFVPAYDSYFIKTFNNLSKGKTSFNKFSKQSLEAIYQFYIEHRSEIDKLSNDIHVLNFDGKFDDNNHYTRAKIIDMYGFQKNFEPGAFI